MLLQGQAKRTYAWFKSRMLELDAEREKNNGRLKRHDWWRYGYYASPYLLLEENETIIDRFTAVVTNSLDISKEGQLTLSWLKEGNERFARLFTELIEETNWRGALTQESLEESRNLVRSYFESGEPHGVKLFANFPEESGNWLLKFSKQEFIRDMLDYGRIRISPASFYAKGSHIRAIKDLETVRSYRLKAVDHILRGHDSLQLNGQTFQLSNGVVPIEFEIGNYYLFSTCKEISRRMPSDFDADAVLVIRDKSEFIDRIKSELLISYPNWEFMERDVYYYDPYHDLPTDRDQEFYKHLSFAYQMEHRCIIRPKAPSDAVEPLEPFFVELGALDDISEMLSL